MMKEKAVTIMQSSFTIIKYYLISIQSLEVGKYTEYINASQMNT